MDYWLSGRRFDFHIGSSMTWIAHLRTSHKIWNVEKHWDPLQYRNPKHIYSHDSNLILRYVVLSLFFVFEQKKKEEENVWSFSDDFKRSMQMPFHPNSQCLNKNLAYGYWSSVMSMMRTSNVFLICAVFLYSIYFVLYRFAMNRCLLVNILIPAM